MRAFWAITAVVGASVLALARWLSPDPSGFGTHVQLGLPACGFFRLTSLPCPACGMTTAFAYMARLQITAAFHAHVLGPPLFALTALAVPCCLVACVLGLPVAPTLQRLRVGPLMAMIGIAALLVWMARITAILLA